MPSNPAGSQFDRVRPRTASAQKMTVGSREGVSASDREGKQALFSEIPAPPTVGGVALICSGCGQRSVVSWAQALKLAFPSVPVALPGKGVRLHMKCPECQRRAWVSISTNC